MKLINCGRTGRSRVTAATIPVLLVILAAVYFWPQSGEKAAEIELASTTSKTSLPKGLPRPEKRTWPTTSLKELIAFSPFDPAPVPETSSRNGSVSPSSEESGSETVEKQPAVLGKLQAIYLDERGAAAVVDARVFRVGDRLPSGHLISNIGLRGLMLEGVNDQYGIQ